ncbi:hypothetical protein [Dankookia sp. GCM10030260]|uniref:hypothetical protein n=1 Tax=Dankookia sp. GCM10030260 TaxID=3273390 RepID=UPI0036D2B36C
MPDRLHVNPACCPHLGAIGRPWGQMHEHGAHNRCHTTRADLSQAFMPFPRDEVPRTRHVNRDAVSGNFRTSGSAPILLP